MSPLDILEVVHEVLPRRWKRWLGMALAVCFLATPNAASSAMLWYANQRAQQIVDAFDPIQIESPDRSSVEP